MGQGSITDDLEVIGQNGSELKPKPKESRGEYGWGRTGGKERKKERKCKN